MLSRRGSLKICRGIHSGAAKLLGLYRNSFVADSLVYYLYTAGRARPPRA